MKLTDSLIDQKLKYLNDDDCGESLEHAEMKDRLRKTLYYGWGPIADCPSLAMTEFAVEFLQELAPKELGKVDMYWASTLSRDVYISPCTLMVAMMYARRLKQKQSTYLNNVSSSDLFLVSLMVASKYLYDEGELDETCVDQWMKAANMDMDEICELERNFLSAMDWNLFVKSEDFWMSLSLVEQRIAWKKSLERGNFMYNDLSVLMSNNSFTLALYQVLVEICQVVLICCVTYVVSVLVLSSARGAFGLVMSSGSLVSMLPSQLLSSEITNTTPVNVKTNASAVETSDELFNLTLDELDQVSTDRHRVSTLIDEVSSWPGQIPTEHLLQHPIEPVSPHVIRSCLGVFSLPSFLTLAILKNTVIDGASSLLLKVPTWTKQLLSAKSCSVGEQMQGCTSSNSTNCVHCCQCLKKKNNFCSSRSRRTPRKSNLASPDSNFENLNSIDTGRLSIPPHDYIADENLHTSCHQEASSTIDLECCVVPANQKMCTREAIPRKSLTSKTSYFSRIGQPDYFEKILSNFHA